MPDLQNANQQQPNRINLGDQFALEAGRGNGENFGVREDSLATVLGKFLNSLWNFVTRGNEEVSKKLMNAAWKEHLAGREIESAISFNKAAVMNPGILKLASKNEEIKDFYTAAERLISQVKGSKDKLLSTAQIGELYLYENKYDRAVEYFESALLADPKCQRSHAGAVEAYVALGENEKALSHYQKLVKLNPNKVDQELEEKLVIKKEKVEKLESGWSTEEKMTVAICLLILGAGAGAIKLYEDKNREEEKIREATRKFISEKIDANSFSAAQKKSFLLLSADKAEEIFEKVFKTQFRCEMLCQLNGNHVSAAFNQISFSSNDQFDAVRDVPITITRELAGKTGEEFLQNEGVKKIEKKAIKTAVGEYVGGFILREISPSAEREKLQEVLRDYLLFSQEHEDEKAADKNQSPKVTPEEFRRKMEIFREEVVSYFTEVHRTLVAAAVANPVVGQREQNLRKS